MNPDDLPSRVNEGTSVGERWQTTRIEIMEAERFIRNETEALTDRRFETLVKLPRVPLDTCDRVVKVDYPTGSNIFILAIDLEVDATIRGDTVRDSRMLSRDEMQRFLREVCPQS